MPRLGQLFERFRGTSQEQRGIICISLPFVSLMGPWVIDANEE